MGDANLLELRALASRPYAQSLFFSTSYTQFPDTLNNVRMSTCDGQCHLAHSIGLLNVHLALVNVSLMSQLTLNHNTNHTHCSSFIIQYSEASFSSFYDVSFIINCNIILKGIKSRLIMTSPGHIVARIPWSGLCLRMQSQSAHRCVYHLYHRLMYTCRLSYCRSLWTNSLQSFRDYSSRMYSCQPSFPRYLPSPTLPLPMPLPHSALPRDPCLPPQSATPHTNPPPLGHRALPITTLAHYPRS